MALWRVDEGEPRRLSSASLSAEQDLETFIEQDPDILGQRLLLIGRQVRTTHGGVIDLLAVDGEGALHVLELKRDKTAREVLAQALDYGSWVGTLSHTAILGIHAAYDEGTTFEAAFEERFGTPPPEELNTAHSLTIVAARLDEATERILGYLGDFGVPVNAVFFTYFEDEGRRYLAREWLRDEFVAEPAPRGVAAKREPWNGLDWYAAFGEDEVRSWEDARRFGFVSAGGGRWFSQALERPPIGARVNAYIPKAGYVGIGIVCGEAARFADATVTVDGSEVRLADAKLIGRYAHAGQEADPDLAEWVLPVRWLDTVGREQAVRRPGVFASQHPACKLRSRNTLDILAASFPRAASDPAT